MRRRSLPAAFGLFLGVLVAGLGATAAAAAVCPNEAFRTGPGSLLAECRAYEQVTPIDKEAGTGVSEFGGVFADPEGNGIWYQSISAFSGAASNSLFNAYVGTRTGGGWSTVSNSVPEKTELYFLIHTAYAVTDDLGLALVGSEEALTPGASPGGSNLYVMDTRTGALTLVLAAPSSDAFKRDWANVGGQNPLVGADPDWSAMIIASPKVLAPGAVQGKPNLYEWRDGQLRTVVAEGAAAGTSETTPDVVSTDASRFYYVKEEILYLHQRDGETLRVSEDEAGIPITGSTFLGATPDDGIAFFSYNGTLYRFEASAPAGRRITTLTPPVPGQGETASVRIAAVGEDGEDVYFSSAELLTEDAEPRTVEPGPFGDGYDLYVWHGAPGQPGGIHYIGKSEATRETGPTNPTVSSNGRFFAFESVGGLTPDVVEGSRTNCPEPQFGGEGAGHCENVFLYSLDSDGLSCVSCVGLPPVGGTRLGGVESRRENRNVPKALLDDGMVFFDTADPLVARDANGVRDAYAWRDGRLQLISTGTDSGPSSFIDATPDGRNVYFQTQQSLVGQDTDTSLDLYDARVEGGLPQGGTVATPPCSSENSCRTGVAPSAPTAMPPSEAEGGAGACLSLQTRAREARRRSHVLAHRAKKAKAGHAKALRRSASREARQGRQLGRRAGKCTGGGR